MNPFILIIAGMLVAWIGQAIHVPLSARKFGRIPTPFYLKVFTSPFYSWSVAAVGILMLIGLSKWNKEKNPMRRPRRRHVSPTPEVPHRKIPKIKPFTYPGQ